MNYIFFGTPNFAAVILEKLIDAGFIPAVVVCNPDKPIGRKQIITKPPVKIIAEKHGIKAYQPQKLEIGNCLPAGRHGKLEIGEIVYDFAVIAAYSKIIPKEILDIPRLGTIGVHPSLLPRHRGATPIQTAILSGDKTTGVTLFLVDEKIDHGNIIANSELQIANFDTYETLETKLAELGTNMLIEFLKKLNFQYNEVGLRYIEKTRPQDESQATYTKKFTTQDAFIEPSDLEKAEKDGGEIAVHIERKIRALNPEPGVWTTMSDCKIANCKIAKLKRVKLLEAEIIGGKLVLKKIQAEGKKPQKL